MQFLLTKNQVNINSLAAILEGQTQAEWIGFQNLASETKLDLVFKGIKRLSHIERKDQGRTAQLVYVISELFVVGA